MKCRYRLLTLLLLAALLLSVAQPLMAQENPPAPEPVGLRLDTAFLLAELKGDAEAAAALAPENVSFPGIQYEAMGYAGAAALDSELIAEIEALVEQVMAEHQIPGVAVGIVKDGAVVYANGFGVAEHGSDRAMTPQTQIAVACVTKGFTTAAIMQLVEQGLIDLDAPVTDYLPYFKLADDRYTEITIRHLLTNAAGLPMPNYVAMYGFSPPLETSPELLEAYVRSLASRSMEADPADNQFMYGNDYFDILGDVIAKVSGQPFEQYVEEHLLTPLGLEHTTFFAAEVDPALATAYHWQDDAGEMQFEAVSPSYVQVHTPSHGLISNTEDLLKWAQFNLNRGALNGQQIVPPFAYDEMWKPQIEIGWGGFFQDYGFGWGVAEEQGHRLAFWGGNHIGSSNTFVLAPDDDLALFVAVNRTAEKAKGTIYSGEIAFPIIKMLLSAEGYGAAQAAEDAAAITSGYVDNDGVNIYYEVEGQGPPLVLVHWASGSTEDWRMFGYVDALKDDYRLILVDMRGHGKSDKPRDPAAYDAATQASDILAVLDELGIDKANFFGYSLGGRLGWALAKYAPDRFQSLIIGGHVPGVWDDSGWTAWMFSQGAEGWVRGLEDFARSLDRWNPEIYPAYVADDFGAIAMASYGLNSEDLSSNLPGTTTPILLLVGTNDDMHADMKAASQRLPNATMAELADLDHGEGYLLVEQVLPPITEFLTEVNADAAAPTSRLDAATIAEIETLVEEVMAKGQVPGAAVGVVKDGELVYAKGFGVGELGGAEPVTPETVFVMISIAKSGVGMAIMQLVEEGKIDLDAPVTDYLPDFIMVDPDVEEVTIRQLLLHTSGIPDPVDFVAEYQKENKRTDEGALDDYVRSLSEQSLLFRPGEDWAYSNTGFDILANVVANVSGQSFEEYVQEHILTPLGMKNSSYLQSDVDPARLAAPHAYDDAGNAAKLDFLPYARFNAPAAGLLSSVDDIARFAIANMNHGELDGTRVLSAATYDEMWAPQVASPWGDFFGPFVANYGLGWWIGDFNGHSIIANYGADIGFQTYLGIFPDEGLAVIAMANLHDPEAGSFLASDVGFGTAEILLEEIKPQ